MNKIFKRNNLITTMLILILVLLLVLLFTSNAHAAESKLLDEIVSNLEDEAKKWEPYFRTAGLRLFWILASISVVWTGVELMLKRADIGEYFAQLIRLILFIGFFYYLVNGAGIQLANALLSSMQQLASSADSRPALSSHITPSSVIDIIGDLYKGIENVVSFSSPIDSLAYILIFFVGAICLGFIAANYVLTLVSAYIIIYSGLILLGFGGSRWTNDIVISYIKQVFNICLQVLVIILLIKLASIAIMGYLSVASTQLPDGWFFVGGWGIPSIFELVKVVIKIFIITVASVKIPPIVGGIIGGSGVGAGMGAGVAAGAAMGAAGAAGASMAIAAKAMTSVATNTAGLTKAISAQMSGGGGKSNTTGLSSESKSADTGASSSDGNSLSGGSGGDSGGDSGSDFSGSFGGDSGGGSGGDSSGDSGGDSGGGSGGGSGGDSGGIATSASAFSRIGSLTKAIGKVAAAPLVNKWNKAVDSSTMGKVAKQIAEKNKAGKGEDI